MMRLIGFNRELSFLLAGGSSLSYHKIKPFLYKNLICLIFVFEKRAIHRKA